MGGPEKAFVTLCVITLLGILFFVIAGTTTWFGEELHTWMNQPSDITICYPVGQVVIC